MANVCKFIHKGLCKSNSSLSSYDLQSRYKLSAMGDATKDVSSPVPLWIGGKEVTTETTFDVISPNDGKKLWSASSVSPKEAVQAVEAAQTALKTWRKVKPAQIRTILLKAADIFEARQEELSKYMMEETGALTAFTGFNLTVTAENFRDVAGRAANILGAVRSGNLRFKHMLIMIDPTNGYTWAGSIPIQGAVRSELWHCAMERYD